jgi:UV DNA damage endonuclease
VQSLRAALVYCHKHGIGSFRVLSQLLPLYTHPEYGYQLERLGSFREMRAVLEDCSQYAEQHQLRLTFHPDQFVVLNSTRDKVVSSSVKELEYQARVAEIIGADVINIHLGGKFGDQQAALRRLQQNLGQLSAAVRERLTFENDDRTYNAEEALRFCEDNGYPMVYDVHHHRCLPDALTVSAATERACQTWNREPLFHISSPIAGWSGERPERHHDYIDLQDFPTEWLHRELTVEVEAKAKELAVERLLQDLDRQ